MKSTVFNLIILDESGSMTAMTQQTISGCNETLNTIRSSQKTHGDSLRNFVSIYAFQDGGEIKSRYLIKNAKPEEVKDVTDKDYRPWGSTPLYDAVGSTLTELKAIAATHEDATGIVTIMTDGYENASRRYSGAQVAALISELREIGWTINLIGADIDVKMMARSMNISEDNTLCYSGTEEGTRVMWDKYTDAVTGALDAEASYDCAMPTEERRSLRKSESKSFFKRRK